MNASPRDPGGRPPAECLAPLARSLLVGGEATLEHRQGSGDLGSDLRGHGLALFARFTLQ